MLLLRGVPEATERAGLPSRDGMLLASSGRWDAVTGVPGDVLR
jgi:hypothetical protein